MTTRKVCDFPLNYTPLSHAIFVTFASPQSHLCGNVTHCFFGKPRFAWEMKWSKRRTLSLEHRSCSGKAPYSKATQASRSDSDSICAYGCKSSYLLGAATLVRWP